jgi:hypothetical protein
MDQLDLGLHGMDLDACGGLFSFCLSLWSFP